jgi:hypothetical protein
MPKKGLLCLLVALLFFLAGQVQARIHSGSSVNETNCPELWPVQQGKKWGYIDKTGRVVIPFKFDSADQFSEGLALVGIKEKTGYIDKTGNVVIPPRFLSGYPFSSGMALVVTGEFKKDRYNMHKLGYIDRSGKLVIKRKALDTKSLFVIYKDLYFAEGLVTIEQSDKVGFMDRTGKIIIPPTYDDAQSFSEGLAAVKLNDKYGYIDKSGKMAIPFQFKDAGSFHEGLACVTFNGEQRSYIETSGKPVINEEELDIGRPFSQGLAAVRDKKNKYGFIDRTGKLVIQPQFDRVGDFSEGLAAVMPVIDAHWPGNLAYINPKGEIVIQSMSTNLSSPDKVDWDLHNYRFCGGVAMVSAGNEADEDAQVYINQEGKIISPVDISPEKKPLVPGKK